MQRKQIRSPNEDECHLLSIDIEIGLQLIIKAWLKKEIT